MEVSVMRSRLVLGSVVLTTALLGIPAVASAHVHGITPLRCTPAPEHAGANQVNNTPASASNGGPITGLIPRDVGNAPLTGGDGGRDAAVCP